MYALSPSFIKNPAIPREELYGLKEIVVETIRKLILEEVFKYGSQHEIVKL